MCGIAGALSLSPGASVDPEALRTLAAQLVHRGPDADGCYVDPQGRCGLAFRRLSIIDLQTGNQPMANEDGSVQLVFNGEIYNYRALREELRASGHRFVTQSDSEVIAHAYEQWGEECLSRFSGMFAIALWDAERGALLLARDRVGKKPLVYAVFGNTLYFASEAKAILALPGASREVDPQSLHRYLLLQYVPAPHAIFRGFRKLPPASFLRCRAHQTLPAQATSYWAPPRSGPATPARPQDEPTVLRELDERLTAAVARRLVADVPLGAFLSGGVDSSIVVALMHKLGVAPLRTFSIGFRDPRYDETAHARRVAEHMGTEHHEQIVTPQAAEILDTLAHHFDEPFADSSAIPTYYVSRHARAAVAVALTGDGGDECFGGYDRYRALTLAGCLDWLPRPLRSGLAAVSPWLPHGVAKSLGNRAYRFLQALPHAAPRRYLSWMNVFTPGQLAAGYQPLFAARLALDEPVRWFADLFAAGRGPVAAQANRMDVLSYLPYDLLVKVDIASMANSLECRAPFLDHELLEFAHNRPEAWRFAGGGKRILKRWAQNLLPAEILSRPKMGFGVPVGEWFRGELGGVLESAILGPDAVCGRIFRREWLRHLFETHQAGRANHAHGLWALLMLERWAQVWRPTGI